MKTNKISILGGFIGFIIMLGSFMQWQIWHNDTSQFAFGIFCGLIVWGFAYAYSWSKKNDEFHQELNKDMQSVETNFNKILTWKNDLENKKEEKENE